MSLVTASDIKKEIFQSLDEVIDKLLKLKQMEKIPDHWLDNIAEIMDEVEQEEI